MNKIQSLEYNEHRWTDITRAMKIYQKHIIKSQYTDINNEGITILYDSKSAVNYISTDWELRLRALNRTNVVEQNNEKIITVLECNNLSNMSFWKKRDSANYLMISTAHLIKLNLNILKKDIDLKEKKLRSYINIESIRIIKITLYERKVEKIIHKEHKGSYIIRNLWKNIFSKKTSHFNEIIKLTSSNEFKWKEIIMTKESSRKYIVIIISAIHRTEFKYYSITILFLIYFNYWQKQILWKSEIIGQQMIKLNITIRFKERIKEIKLWQKYNVIMRQKTKDSNEILKWYYIHLIHFLNEEDGSASVDNEKSSKNSEKKRYHHERRFWSKISKLSIKQIVIINENINKTKCSKLKKRWIIKFSRSEFKLFSRFKRSKSWIKKIFSRLSKWRWILLKQRIFKFLSSNFLFFRRNWLCFSMQRRCLFKNSFNSWQFFLTFLFSFDFARLIKRHVILLIHKSYNLWF